MTFRIRLALLAVFIVAPAALAQTGPDMRDILQHVRDGDAARAAAHGKETAAYVPVQAHTATVEQLHVTRDRVKELEEQVARLKQELEEARRENFRLQAACDELRKRSGS